MAEQARDFTIQVTYALDPAFEALHPRDPHGQWVDKPESKSPAWVNPAMGVPGAPATFVMQALRNLDRLSTTSRLPSVRARLTDALRFAFTSKDAPLKTPEQVQAFVTEIATRVAGAPLVGKSGAVASLARELAQQFNTPRRNPVVTAAWIERTVDSAQQPLGGASEHTARVLAAFAMRRGGFHQPRYPDRAEFYAHLRSDTWDAWLDFYTGTLLPKYARQFAVDPAFETLHPRDPEGQWTEKPGGGTATLDTPEAEGFALDAQKKYVGTLPANIWPLCVQLNERSRGGAFVWGRAIDLVLDPETGRAAFSDVSDHDPMLRELEPDDPARRDAYARVSIIPDQPKGPGFVSIVPPWHWSQGGGSDAATHAQREYRAVRAVLRLLYQSGVPENLQLFITWGSELNAARANDAKTRGMFAADPDFETLHPRGPKGEWIDKPGTRYIPTSQVQWPTEGGMPYHRLASPRDRSGVGGAEQSSAAWLSPSGQLFQVTESHDEWAEAHLGVDVFKAINAGGIRLDRTHYGRRVDLNVEATLAALRNPAIAAELEQVVRNSEPPGTGYHEIVLDLRAPDEFLTFAGKAEFFAALHRMRTTGSARPRSQVAQWHPAEEEAAVFALRTTFAVDPDFEAQHPRGQTGPETNAGSFAPKGGGSRRQELEAEADRLRTVEGVAVPKVAREEDLARAVTLGQQADTAADHLETLWTNIQEGGAVDVDTVPSSWDDLTAAQQETAEQDWKSAHESSARDSAYETWRESDTYIDARMAAAEEQVVGDEDTQESLVLAGLHAAAKALKIPDYSDEEILDRLDLDEDTRLTAKSLEDPTVLRGLRELFGLPETPAEQIGLFPDANVKDALEDFLDAAREGYETAHTAAVEAAENDVDPDPPEDWLADAVANELESLWDSIEDTERWNWAEKNLDLGSTAESRTLEEPNTWKVDKDGEDYERTGAIGRTLALARYAELSGDSVANGGALARQLWTAWKNSSTSSGGLALQYYAAQVLGGHHRLTDDQQKSARNWARTYGGDGGEANVRAYVRAQWESTQFLLRKAEEQEVELYRAVMLSEQELGRRNVFRPGDTAQFTELPDLALKQSGAASTSTNLRVCNAWNGVGAKPANPRRVVLRARVPATSVISLPAYGQNVHEETEWVVLGTPWYGWDAWLEKAPPFDFVPSDHKLKAIHFQVPRVAMIDFNDPRQTGVGHWLWQRPRRFAWDETQHPRGGKGTEQGGRFVAKAETLRAEDPHQTVWQAADPLRTHYGMLLVNPRERTILLREPTNHFEGYVWTFARGMPEPEEHPLDTALRETQEELGYDAEVQGLLPTVYRGASWASCYYVATPRGDQQPTDWETHRTRWATYEDARRLIGLTRNVIGRARDLRVLDDVFAQMDSRGRGAEAAFADFTLTFAVDPEFEQKHPRGVGEQGGQFIEKPGGPESSTPDAHVKTDPQLGGFEAMRQNMIERFGMTPEQANAQIKGMQQIAARLDGPTKVTPTEAQAAGTHPHTHYPGQCYEMAGRYILDRAMADDANDYTLVHGVIDQSPFGDMRIGHGWVETADGKVFDGTTQEWYERESYYKTFNVEVERRYSPREARRMVFSQENWGCWHQSAGVVNNQLKKPRTSRRRAKKVAA